ncbi:MAG: dephospho-CoA kinase, partial [Planctomycetales bacterium]|nr:dephospho-CoA kinase [Planctomycetales bacterium]
MHIIGIIGGVASGKSAVAKRLAERGAAILDADGAAHDVLRETDVKRRLRERFGDGIFDPQGEVARHALAPIVFAPGEEGAAALADLERIVHPRIGERLQAQ